MATKKEATAKKTAAAAKDPRQSGGTVIESHDHIGAPSARRRLADLDEPPKQAKKSEMVTARVPRAFNLLVLHEGGSKMLRFEQGIQDMPREHAEHEYSLANGVEIVEEDKK